VPGGMTGTALDPASVTKKERGSLTDRGELSTINLRRRFMHAQRPRPPVSNSPRMVAAECAAFFSRLSAPGVAFMRRIVFFVSALLISAVVAVPGYTAGRPQMPRQNPQHHANIPKLHLKAVHEDVLVAPTEDVIVRWYYPPVAHDDKGNVKKSFTASELKSMKEPYPKLVGYTALFSDLKQGQVVYVTLRLKKTGSALLAKKDAPAPTTSAADKDEDKADDKPAGKSVKADSSPKTDDEPKHETKGAFVGKIGGIIQKIDPKTRHITLRVEAATIEAAHKRPPGYRPPQGTKIEHIDLTQIDATCILILAASEKEYESHPPESTSSSSSGSK
jgi:hypothetical protein